MLFLFFPILQLCCVQCDCNTVNFLNAKFGFYSQYSNSFPEGPIIQLSRYRVFKYFSQIPQKSIKLKDNNIRVKSLYIHIHSLFIITVKILNINVRKTHSFNSKKFC